MVVRLLQTLILGFFCAQTCAASVTAYVDRNPVSANESFILTFDVKGKLDAEPDFTPLQALFKVLNSSHSSRVQVTNSGSERSRQWQLNLLALKAGTYTIPSINFGKDRSDPIELVVNEEQTSQSSHRDSIILEAELTPQRQAYVQSQLVYKRRLLRSVQLRDGGLSELKVGGVEVIVERLGDNRTFETILDGMRYLVVEQAFAIFPQESGKLTIEPTVFQGRIARGRHFSTNQTNKTKRLYSDAFEVDILPIPATARRPWLPARKLDLIEQWPEEPPRFKAGEPVTRTLTLTAQGVAASQLPEITGSLPDGLKTYPDQPSLDNKARANGLTASRQEKIAIMPSRPGRYTLPTIEIPWWNTDTEQQEIARIPARTIEVEAVAESTGTPSIPIPAATALEPGNDGTGESQVVEKISAGIWPWLSLALAIGWLTTVLIGWRVSHRPEIRPASAEPKADFRAVKRACQRNDAQACKSALLEWARAYWREQTPTSLGSIATRVDPAFAAALDDLNRSLYSAEDIHWQGDALLEAARHWLGTNRTETTDKASALEPLYPKPGTA